RRVGAVVLNAHHRDLAHLAGARAAHGDHDHRQARVAERRTLRAVGALIQLDLFTHPLARTRLVLADDRHRNLLATRVDNPSKDYPPQTRPSRVIMSRSGQDQRRSATPHSVAPASSATASNATETWIARRLRSTAPPSRLPCRRARPGPMGGRPATAGARPAAGSGTP